MDRHGQSSWGLLILVECTFSIKLPKMWASRSPLKHSSSELERIEIKAAPAIPVAGSSPPRTARTLRGLTRGRMEWSYIYILRGSAPCRRPLGWACDQLLHGPEAHTHTRIYKDIYIYIYLYIYIYICVCMVIHCKVRCALIMYTWVQFC